MKFKDEVEIRIKSGRGGSGAVSFRREKFVPRGGPDGGDGGRGGHVIFKANPDLNTLIDLRKNKVYSAQSGESGGGAHCSGKDGEDLIIEVPVGTIVTMDGIQIADLVEGEPVVALEGGRGGKGNAHFKSSINQTPDKAQPGELGEEAEIFLELKLIADVGMLGFPNAGKSTFVSSVSKARPKIADYPFTTLVPSLGVVSLGPGQSFVVADIPGLIEGAHEGVGLGLKFLKHIQRTRALVHLIDVSDRDPETAVSRYLQIRQELAKFDELYGKEGVLVSNKPEFICLNKIDTLTKELEEDLKTAFYQAVGKSVFPISAVTRSGIEPLLHLLFKEISHVR